VVQRVIGLHVEDREVRVRADDAPDVWPVTGALKLLGIGLPPADEIVTNLLNRR
jgi:hypothetical protein